MIMNSILAAQIYKETAYRSSITFQLRMVHRDLR